MRRSALVVVVLLAAGACGGEAALEVPPPRVPDNLVPTSIQDGRYAFYRSTLPKVTETFSEAGPETLTSDGQLWELRRGERLVGVLQLTSLLPDVDLEREEHREAILRQVMPSTVDRLSVGDVSVWATASNDKVVFLWFGMHVFAVMSLKATEEGIDPETILDEVVGFTTASDEWEPLYLDDDVDAGV